MSVWSGLLRRSWGVFTPALFSSIKYSHLPCLVSLKQSRVCFFPWSELFSQCEYNLGLGLGKQPLQLWCGPNKQTESQFRRWYRSGPYQALARFIWGVKVTRPQSNPSGKSMFSGPNYLPLSQYGEKMWNTCFTDVSLCCSSHASNHSIIKSKIF